MKLTFFIIKFIRYFLILLFAILIFWFFWQNYVPLGYLKATQDFKTSQKFISDFYPKEKIHDDGIVDIPIYFKIKTPQYFKKAYVTIIYQNPSKVHLDLGIRDNLSPQQCVNNKNLSSAEWCKTWGLQKEEYKNKSLSEKAISNEDWQEATLNFSLENIPLIEQNYEFMISVSDKTLLRHKIKVKKIKIILEKDPLIQVLGFMF
ncbi:MAG: hypothetical protein ABH808_02510 [Candidatus Kuenenbacteria bacterium]